MAEGAGDDAGLGSRPVAWQPRQGTRVVHGQEPAVESGGPSPRWSRPWELPRGQRRPRAFAGVGRREESGMRMASCRRRRPRAPPSSWDDDGSSREKTESRGIGSGGRRQKGSSLGVGADGNSEPHELDSSWCHRPGAGPRPSGSRSREPREVKWPSPSWEEVGMVLELGGSRGRSKAWSQSWAGRDEGWDPGVRLCSLNAGNSRKRGSEGFNFDFDPVPPPPLSLSPCFTLELGPKPSFW